MGDLRLGMRKYQRVLCLGHEFTLDLENKDVPHETGDVQLSNEYDG